MDKLFWLIPGQLAGRPGPDDEPWSIASLQRAGIGAVLSVNDGRMCDPAAFAAAGIAYDCMPLSDWVPPQPGDAEHCLEVLPRAYAFVQAQIAQGSATLVHCSAGNDRTGLFLTYFLARHAHLPAAEAIRAVRAVRPTALEAQGWEGFAEQLLGITRRRSPAS